MPIYGNAYIWLYLNAYIWLYLNAYIWHILSFARNNNFCSFAVEVARYRDPVQYSMMTELDCSPVTKHFAMKVRDT